MFSLFVNTLMISIQALFENKTRAILTMLGIIIGVLSVTLMGTLISGLDRSFEKSMSFLGNDVLFISKYSWFSGNEEYWESRNRPQLKLDYVEKLQDVKHVQAVSPSMRHMADVSNGDETISGISVLGTTPDYILTSYLNIEKGRFITSGENRSGSRSIIIGYDVADALFPNQDPIGEKVKLGPYNFKIVGVIERQGKFLGLFSTDNQVIVPLGTFLRLFSRHSYMQIRVKVDQAHLEDAKDEVLGLMRRLRGLRPQEKDDFAINQQEAFRTQYKAIKMVIGGTGLFITIMSLIVGGIGIMNIMFVSVKERTREIGVRKAIGARRSAILGQFLLEAILICFLAGLIGLGLAWSGSILIDKFVFPSAMPLWLGIGSMFLSIVVGVLSGIAPSFKAAKLDPIEALRYE